ncbi:hypothetical protein T484DRAFT_1825625 [Baffinella frigidus]|nr:hypothetical protein T484DRAFT_1825625 [Cryptophyta sp. CCMP2293]
MRAARSDAMLSETQTALHETDAGLHAAKAGLALVEAGLVAAEARAAESDRRASDAEQKAEEAEHRAADAVRREVEAERRAGDAEEQEATMRRGVEMAHTSEGLQGEVGELREAHACLDFLGGEAGEVREALRQRDAEVLRLTERLRRTETESAPGLADAGRHVRAQQLYDPALFEEAGSANARGLPQRLAPGARHPYGHCSPA